MKRKSKAGGFDYYLSRETMEDYRKKPLELRLKWLYAGNLLRKRYSERVVRLQDKFRDGEI